MGRALNVLRDHVAAVMDVEFSPTGEEIVSASYDVCVISPIICHLVECDVGC